MQKQMDRSRCSLGAELGGPKEPCITWGADTKGKGQFLREVAAHYEV